MVILSVINNKCEVPAIEIVNKNTQQCVDGTLSQVRHVNFNSYVSH